MEKYDGPELPVPPLVSWIFMTPVFFHMTRRTPE
jgi:hypothetical protein